MLRSFGNHDEDGIEDSYDVSKLPGFTDGVDNLYVEVELAYDSRRQPSFWQSKVLDATGWYAAAHLGLTFRSFRYRLQKLGMAGGDTGAGEGEGEGEGEEPRTRR